MRNFVEIGQSIAEILRPPPPSSILTLANLLDDDAQRAQSHHCAKRRQNQSFYCGDIAIFLFLRWPLLPSSIFEIVKFYWRTVPGGSSCITVPIS